MDNNTMRVLPMKKDIPFLDRFRHFSEVGETITLLVTENQDGTVTIVRWFLEVKSYSNETIPKEQYKKERDNRIRNLSDVENGIVIPELGVFPTIELFRGLDRDIPDNGLITTALWDIPQNRTRKGGHLIVLRVPDGGDVRIERINTEINKI